MEGWLSKRIPDNHLFKMDMSNIFIFPSRFGIWFLILCALLFILGSNYRNNLMLLLSFFLLALFLASLMNSFANFAKLQIQAGRVHPVFAGEKIQVPLWLSDTEQSSDIADLPEGKLYFRLWQEPVQLDIDLNRFTNPALVQVPTVQRGLHKLPRITIESYYPLGIYRCWTHLKFDVQALVYPTPIPCELTFLSSDKFNDDLDEGAKVQQQSGTDDFDSLRSYIVGEPLHRVAWKQVAKGQGMISKQFNSVEPDIKWLDLQCFEHLDVETALSHLTYQVLECAKKGLYFGLRLHALSIEPDSGEQHTENCLYALATFPSSPATTATTTLSNSKERGTKRA